MKFKSIAKLFLIPLLLLLTSTPSFAALLFTNIKYENAGSEVLVYGRVTFDSSYPTNGEAVPSHALGLNQIDQILIPTSNGYVFNFDIANRKIKAFQSGAATAQTFTGTSPTSALNLTTPVFSGTGQASSGQVITTTDNQTMTLNQCAGMWFVSATHGPYLIASNTAVTGAPAVLTIIGTAPTTDAGIYRILKSLTPVGTNGASTAASLAEIPNATDLSAVTSIPFIALGKY